MEKSKKAKWERIIAAMIYIVLGVILTIFPETTARTLCVVLGCAVIVFGAVKLIASFTGDHKEAYLKNDFTVGVVSIVIGVLILVKVDLVVAIVPFVLGMLVLVSGVNKLQNAIYALRNDSSGKIWMLVSALINVALGVLVIFNPFGTAVLLFLLIGIFLIFSGVTDLLDALIFNKKLRASFEEE